ncbi:MAG: Xaa-Pro peptidase family protein [Ardenticatenaceae bacterium]|nr:Xaa-Pro peptidase family protein [Ardenticatenaceae bacterium]
MGTIADIAERDMRFRRIREEMAREGLEALIVAGKGHWWTGRGYIRYLTDFHLWGHDGLILLPLSGEPVMTLTSYAVAERIANRGWISDVRGDVYLAPKLIAAMKEKGFTKGKVGIAGLRWVMPAGAYLALTEALPNVNFVSADNVIDRVRRVKSPLEIRQIRELWTLSKAAMERFVEVVVPGKSQRELAAEASKVVLAGGGRDILVFISEGAMPSNPPQDVPVRCDDILSYHMEICGESGHWSEITVTCAYREPTELELKLMDSELRAYEEIRKMAKPGARLSDMANTFERALIEDGWTLGEPTEHFDFHGQGMDTIEYPWYAADKNWGNSQDTELEAGMVFSYHPRRNVFPAVGRGTGINEDILITEHGVERLSGDWDLRWRGIE